MIDRMEGFPMIDRIEGLDSRFRGIDKIRGLLIETLDSHLHGNDRMIDKIKGFSIIDK